VRMAHHRRRFRRDAILWTPDGVAPKAAAVMCHPHPLGGGTMDNNVVFRAARGLGYRVMGWTFGVWDTALPGAEEIRRRVRSKLRPGAVLLLHDGDGYDPAGDRRQTAEALPGIIADVRAAGYEFRPLEALLAP